MYVSPSLFVFFSLFLCGCVADPRRKRKARVATMGTFEAFLLAAAEKAPFLVGEVTPVVGQWMPQKRARGGDAVTDEGGRTTKQPATHEEEVARLQRLLVDGPLQPLGLEHAVYHVLLPAFTAAVGAAREVWRATAALRAGEAEAATQGADATRQGSGESAGASADPNAIATGTPSGTPPSVEALQRAVTAAQAKLTAQRQLLDAAGAKLRATVEAVTSTCATAQMP
ncbi:hypothetical protein TRSC58_05639 [Trypanosoma rangeli SC58]|uniref:Uncharacterized protein n=1 Tax=Trypanosoma rangeli SC58 TaxID=429131 RepID=A0A061IVI0_TRYRA|nr:hypothetical protein TRSC58_05639 [Trypanosoma rangeli SC58]